MAEKIIGIGAWKARMKVEVKTMSFEQIMQIVKEVQQKVQYVFTADEVQEFLAYTRRKCEVNGKGEPYVPILFENELRDYVARKRINLMGYLNYLKKQEAVASV